MPLATKISDHQAKRPRPNYRLPAVSPVDRVAAGIEEDVHGCQGITPRTWAVILALSSALWALIVYAAVQLAVQL